MIEQQPKYESYKDSGVEWLGEIPSEWNLLPGFRFFTENKRSNKGMIEETVLSLSYGKIIVKPKEKLVGLVPESFETYQIVEPGDIIVRCTDLQNDKVSLRTGLALNDGIITSAYLNLKVANDCEPRYLHYFLHSLDTTKVIYKFGSGLRQNLSYLDFKRLPVFDISQNVQRAIADFLDIKTAQIDEAIAIKQKQIEQLKERKQIIIQQAVTQGLNPDAPMKDSGVDWIGEIPEHWGIVRFKNLFTQSRLPVRKGDGVVTSYRDGQVTLRSNRRVGGYTEAILEGGYQGIRKGQLVLNSMDAFEGAIGVSDSDGKCTPEYVICDPINSVDVSQYYFAYLLREMALAKYIQVICNAVRQRAVRIRYNNLAPLFMVVPPVKEQEDIVSFIEKESTKLDAGTKHLNEQISKLKEYKTTLINSVVTGKIKVTELA
ncbi:restriction endonuclease subunit S [Vibrio parahaemolyticus]|nr:restriction endonuclease subunit S [Vibrio parahaemolyticus]EJB8417791.1 restriction endonuclease subunit S [Vibrio vulnificus]ELA9713896.1 restriction endonuclease subunit S [Vibrio parahaemolyticus]ELA9727521.1 restriction endonuclease subunit S [Vibrio parahaemolyticus]MBE4453422.1 restriction endonuclease subunit S [Vibrio parahaemolyticus]